jgi:hypothetical protein
MTKPRTRPVTTIAISDLELLRAKAVVCDSYTRILVGSDPPADRVRLQKALAALSRLKVAITRESRSEAMNAPTRSTKLH